MAKNTVNKALFNLRQHVSSAFGRLLESRRSFFYPRSFTYSGGRGSSSGNSGAFYNTNYNTNSGASGNTYSGRWFSGNFFNFDFSSPSCAGKAEKTTKDTNEAESKGSAMGFLMLAALITIVTGLMTYLVSFLSFRDWTYHSMETYEKRFARGTQRIQSIIEICFAFTCGAMAFKIAGGVLLLATVLSGMPATVLASSSTVKAVAYAFSGLSFYAGFIAGNSAVVSFLRWMFPLGTGTGRFRLDARYRQCLSQSKDESQYKALGVRAMIESLKSSELNFSERSRDLFIEFIFALEAVAGHTKRVDLWALDNMVDSLRSLKNILKKEEERAADGSTGTSSKELKEALSSLIDMIKARPNQGIEKHKIQDCYKKFKDWLGLQSDSSVPDTVKIATGLAFKCLFRLEEIINIGDSQESSSCSCGCPHHRKPEDSAYFSDGRTRKRGQRSARGLNDPFVFVGSRCCNSGEGKGLNTPGAFASSCFRENF